MIGRLAIAAVLALAAPSAPAPVPLDSRPPDPPPAIPDPALGPLGGAHPPVALLVDARSGQQLYAERPDVRFLPASMTKAMTLYLAFELIAAGKLGPEQRFVYRPEVWQAWNGQGSAMFFRPGEEIALDTLLHAIATASANDAAVVLAEGYAGSVPAWTALMNAEAKKLGMTGSHFATPNGWPDGGATYVTAADLVRLGEALVTRHPALYRRYFGQPVFEWGGGHGRNQNPILGVVAGADGIKTGKTREAGYNLLGSAERGGRRLFMVIGSAASEEERAAAARALIEWGFTAWNSRALFAPGAQVGRARVQGGDALHVSLRTQTGAGMSWPAGAEPPARLRIVYNGPLVAPVRKGDRVAELEIAVAGTKPARVPLVAGESVGRGGPLDRLAGGLLGWMP